MPRDLTIDIGDRRELFVDRSLIEKLDGAELKLHTPQLAPPAASPICGAYMTVFMDGGRYRAYYRQYDPAYRGEKHDGNAGEMTCYAESPDGIEWNQPELGICEVGGSRRNNAVLANRPPFCHNFAPFLDANPQAAPAARYKALAGTHPKGARPGGGLHAFASADGLHWQLMRDSAVVTFPDFAFDSQNVSFWSAAEGRYVCYFRTWQTSHGRLRTISRTTSEDLLHWTEPVATNPNLPGEHLYTSQTHPYFRAPHIYIALPTRFRPDRGSSTDILFMATRAGTSKYERLFTEAFIRPGIDPQRWGNRSNYAACGVVPTGPAEMSIYHAHSGRRYTLRTDGFVSVHAGSTRGELLSRPLTFAGGQLTINYSTSAGGGIRLEMQDEQGRPLPGLSLADCDEIYGDELLHVVTWRGNGDVTARAGRPVRLRVQLTEADLFSLRFTKPGTATDS